MELRRRFQQLSGIQLSIALPFLALAGLLLGGCPAKKKSPPEKTEDGVTPSKPPCVTRIGQKHQVRDKPIVLQRRCGPVTVPVNWYVNVVKIEPGVELRIAPGRVILVGKRLEARGTKVAPIRFVRTGGGRDGSILLKKSTAILEHVVLDGMGILAHQGAPVNLQRVVVRNTNGFGLTIFDGRSHIQHTRVEKSTGGVMVWADVYGALFAPGNVFSRISVVGDLATGKVRLRPVAPHRIGGLTIGAGATLEIPAGMQLAMDGMVTVVGTLVALGTKAKPIRFQRRKKRARPWLGLKLQGRLAMREVDVDGAEKGKALQIEKGAKVTLRSVRVDGKTLPDRDGDPVDVLMLKSNP